ncbi:MAG TPA: HAD-IC family P-type ATPase, partial [Bryobacteraceae bacterium]|nr:HAD-IC family P-type ATPase [Bryobacteraceae bacterium]
MNLEAPIGTTVHAETGASAPRVTTRHNGIAGRARLQVLGLRGNDRLREALEALDLENGIERLSASAITGNVLVFYDPGRDLEEIVGYLEVVVQQPPPPPAKSAAPRPPAGGGILGFLRSLLTRAERPHPPELTPARPRRPGPAEGHAPEALPKPWHTAGAGQAAAFWRTSVETGLASAEAAARLERYGSNLLPPPRGRSALSILAEQFLSLPVLLLAGSAALSLVTGGIADAIVIGAVVALNAGIGFATEFHADRTILSLLEISEPEARVLRDGRVEVISGDEVVPGDLLVLSHGRPVVADARLVACTRLTVDEAALTGESLPLEKRPAALGEQRLPLAERRNMVYRGTVVTGGQGLAIVVATGRHTEIGKVQELLAESIQPETPLQRQMHRLGTQLTWMICGVSAGMFALGMLRGYSALEMLRSAISLAIAAVPEGLPTVATVCLANGMRSLMRENVLARRLAAVEALGAVETLCFDKTGTLTWNRMSAVAVHTGMRHYTVSGAAFHSGDRTVTPASHGEFSKLLEVCALCSEAGIQWRDGEWAIDGSPTESALVRLALHGGLEVDGLRHRYPLAGMRHRTESEAYMITTHRLPNGRELIAVKGSPAQVLQLCDWFARDDQVHPLAGPERGEILQANANMARRGLRVLGAACVEREPGTAGGERFVWLGLVGLADPPRQGLKEVIAQFHRAGVRPLMLTGDQPATAEAVAEALGLNGNTQPVAARATDFDGLDPHAAASLMRRATVFSRVTPSHKLQIVRALQSEGEIVVMT